LQIHNSVQEVDKWSLQAFNFNYLTELYLIALSYKSPITKRIIVFNADLFKYQSYFKQ